MSIRALKRKARYLGLKVIDLEPSASAVAETAAMPS
jgi:hypothetical protein